jgi:hypothetical protein
MLFQYDSLKLQLRFARPEPGTQLNANSLTCQFWIVNCKLISDVFPETLRSIPVTQIGNQAAEFRPHRSDFFVCVLHSGARNVNPIFLLLELIEVPDPQLLVFGVVAQCFEVLSKPLLILE